jgi:hypothetical protein
MTSTTQCNARVAVWASECGFCPPEDYYTVAVQCGKSRVDDDCLCKIHTKNLPFGTFGKKAPQVTLTKCSIGEGDSKFDYKAGEKMCWLYKNPDGVIGEDGIHKVNIKSDELDNDFWETEDYTDYSDCEDSDDSDYSDNASSGSDNASSGSDDGTTDYSTLKIADLKADLKQRGIKTSGKKDEIIERLKKHDSDPDSFKTKKRKSDKPRKPSVYNLFMSKQIPIYKTAHPDTDHKTAFLACAAAWKTADDNPKKK